MQSFQEWELIMRQIAAIFSHQILMDLVEKLQSIIQYINNIEPPQKEWVGLRNDHKKCVPI